MFTRTSLSRPTATNHPNSLPTTASAHSRSGPLLCTAGLRLSLAGSPVCCGRIVFTCRCGLSGSFRCFPPRLAATQLLQVLAGHRSRGWGLPPQKRCAASQRTSAADISGSSPPAAKHPVNGASARQYRWRMAAAHCSAPRPARRPPLRMNSRKPCDRCVLCGSPPRALFADRLRRRAFPRRGSSSPPARPEVAPHLLGRRTMAAAARHSQCPSIQRPPAPHPGRPRPRPRPRARQIPSTPSLNAMFGPPPVRRTSSSTVSRTRTRTKKYYPCGGT